MGGNGLGDMDADRSDLLLSNGPAGQGPDAGELADALCRDAEVFTCEDERLFHQADEVDRAKVGTAFAG